MLFRSRKRPVNLAVERLCFSEARACGIEQMHAEVGEDELFEVTQWRLSFLTGFDVWANQPALRHLEQFILTDLGVHLLDTARACFGEAQSLYCQVHRTLAPAVRGENVATLLMAMGEAKTSVTIELAHAKRGGACRRLCVPFFVVMRSQ